MVAETGSRSGAPARASRPTISVCEGAPGCAVFIESGNTDGWTATDLAVSLEP